MSINQQQRYFTNLIIELLFWFVKGEIKEIVTTKVVTSKRYAPAQIIGT